MYLADYLFFQTGPRTKTKQWNVPFKMDTKLRTREQVVWARGQEIRDCEKTLKRETNGSKSVVWEAFWRLSAAYFSQDAPTHEGLWSYLPPSKFKRLFSGHTMLWIIGTHLEVEAKSLNQICILCNKLLHAISMVLSSDAKENWILYSELKLALMKKKPGFSENTMNLMIKFRCAWNQNLWVHLEDKEIKRGGSNLKIESKYWIQVKISIITTTRKEPVTEK